jgi:hypothetical protein
MTSRIHRTYVITFVFAAISSLSLMAKAESEPPRGSFFVSGTGELNAAPATLKSALSSHPLDEELKGSYRPRLFWLSQLRAGFAMHDCNAYLHNSSVGAINTTQETLQFWKSYSEGGFQPANGSRYTLNLESFNMRGSGVGAGCAWDVATSLRVLVEFNHAILNDANWKSVHGTAGASQGVTYVNATDLRWGMSPMLPQLQSTGEAKAQWLGLSAKWKSESLPIHVDLDMPVWMGRIYANQVPYMNRNWNLTKTNGVIKSGEDGTPIGTYGNESLTYRIPTLWNIKGSYAHTQQLQPTIYTQGVGSNTTFYLGNTWSSWTGGESKLEVLVDTHLETLLIATTSASWSLGVGVALQKSSDFTQPIMLKYGLRY